MPKAKKVKQVEPTFDRENIRALIWGLRNAGLSWKEVAQNATIRRAFNECGYVARVKRKKPLLTAEEKRKRLQWANEHKTWTVDKWKNVIWADETAFTPIWESREYTWTKKDAPDILVDEAVTPTKKFGGGKLMVWGCIIYEGTGFFCKIDDT